LKGRKEGVYWTDARATDVGEEGSSDLGGRRAGVEERWREGKRW
jgi:hypothetical protein